MGRKPKRSHKVKLYHMGECKTPEQWSQALGIPLRTIINRIDKKYPVELVLKKCEKKQTESTISYNGITDTIKGWSERTGLSEVTIRRRLFYHDDPTKNWSVKDALTTPPADKTKVEYYDDIENDEIERIFSKANDNLDAADEYIASFSKIEYELTDNVEEEVAATEPEPPQQARVWNGTPFKEIPLYVPEIKPTPTLEELLEDEDDLIPADEFVVNHTEPDPNEEEAEWRPDPKLSREENIRNMLQWKYDHGQLEDDIVLPASTVDSSGVKDLASQHAKIKITRRKT